MEAAELFTERDLQLVRRATSTDTVTHLSEEFGLSKQRVDQVLGRAHRWAKLAHVMRMMMLAEKAATTIQDEALAREIEKAGAAR
jgi:predicted aldo/keto reductase-like oxidoreductase